MLNIKETKVSKYIGNLGKSVAYSAIEILDKNSPASKEFVETNAPLFKEIYVATKNYKSTIKTAGALMKSSKIYEAGDLAWRNTLDSIKTGAFYSKERTDKTNLEAMGELGDMSDLEGGLDDFSFDDSWDDDDMGHLSDTIEESSQKSAEATANVIAKSTEYMASTSRANTKMMMIQTDKILNVLSAGFSSSNESMARVSDVISGPMVDFMQNTDKRLEKMTVGVDAIVGILTEMNERQKITYNGQQKGSKERTTIDDVIGSEGTVDIKEYLKVIRKNLKTAMGPAGDMLLGDGMGEGSNMLKTFAANPLAFVPTLIVSQMLPKTMENAMERFNETASGFFANMIGQLNKLANDEDSGLFKYVGKILGIDNRFSTSLDTSRYNRGPIPFDGETKKAITEVIPTLLRAVVKNTGNEKTERIFDYKTGRWTTDAEVISQGKNIRKGAIRSSLGDVQSEMSKYLYKVRPDDIRDFESMNKNLENMMSRIFDDYGTINFNDKRIEDRYSDYGVNSKEEFQLLLAAMKALPRNLVTNMAKNVQSTRTSVTKRMNQMSDDGGIDILNNYFNNSIQSETSKALTTANIKDQYKPNNSLYNSIDNSGNNVFYYLRVIANDIHAIRNGSGMGGGISSGVGDGYDTSDYPSKIITTDWDDSAPDNYKARKDAYTAKERSAQSFSERVEKDKSELVDRAKRISAQYSSYMDENDVKKVINEIELIPIDRLVKETRNLGEFDSYVIKKLNKYANMELPKSKDKDGKEKTGLISELLAAQDLSGKVDVVKKSIGELATLPTKQIERILNVADDRLYNMMFGYKDQNLMDKRGNPVRGFIGHMVYELENSFSKFNSFLDEKILDPLKKKLGIDSMGELFDKALATVGLTSERRAEMRAKVREVWQPFEDSLKSNFKGAKDEVKGALTDAYNQTYNAATGKFTKNQMSDIIKDSTSRMTSSNPIIPNFIGSRIKSEAPSPTDNTNDMIQSVFNTPKYTGIGPRIPNYAKGTRFVENTGLAMLSKGEMVIPSEMNPFYENAGKRSKVSELTEENKIRHDIINMAMGAKNRATGTGNMSEFGNNAKELVQYYGPDIVGKGAVGGVAGAILMGNPILGAAVGGLVSLAKNSESVNKMIFGTEKHDGIKSGGLLSDDFQKKFNATVLNDMKTFGIAGTAASFLLPFGPVAGLMMGSALGYAKNNKSFMDYIFGEEITKTDKDGKEVTSRAGGLVGPDAKQFLEKAFPNIAKGALAGVIGGAVLGSPFGLMGNLMLGSAAGLYSATDDFKSWFFGEEKDGKRQGGILEQTKVKFMNYIDTEIFGNIKKFMSPMAQMLKNMVTGIGRGIQDGVRSIMEKTLGAPLGKWLQEHILQPVGGVVKGAGRLAIGVGKNVVAAPFRALGGIGDGIRKSQIRKGTAYDMTARDRLDYMGDRRYGLRQQDEYLAGLDNDQIAKLSGQLDTISMSDRDFSNQDIDASKRLFSKTDQYLRDNKIKMSTKARDRLLKQAESGRVSSMNKATFQLPYYGAKFGMNLDQQNELFNILQAGSGEIADIKDRRKLAKGERSKIFDEINSDPNSGLNFITDKNSRKYADLLRKEKSFRDKMKTDADELVGKEDPMLKNSDKTVDLLTQLATSQKELVELQINAAQGGDLSTITDPVLKAKIKKKRESNAEKQSGQKFRQNVLSGALQRGGGTREGYENLWTDLLNEKENKKQVYNPIRQKFETWVKDGDTGDYVLDNKSLSERDDEGTGFLGRLLDKANDRSAAKKAEKEQEELDKLGEKQSNTLLGALYSKFTDGFSKVSTIAKWVGGGLLAASIAGHGLKAYDEHIAPVVASKWDQLLDWLKEKGGAIAKGVDYLSGGAVTGEHIGTGLPTDMKNLGLNTIGWFVGGNVGGTEDYTNAGLPLLLKQGFNYFSEGLGYFLEKVVANSVITFAKIAPHIVKGLLTGIKEVFLGTNFYDMLINASKAGKDPGNYISDKYGGSFGPADPLEALSKSISGEITQNTSSDTGAFGHSDASQYMPNNYAEQIPDAKYDESIPTAPGSEAPNTTTTSINNGGKSAQEIYAEIGNNVGGFDGYTLDTNTTIIDRSTDTPVEVLLIDEKTELPMSNMSTGLLYSNENIVGYSIAIHDGEFILLNENDVVVAEMNTSGQFVSDKDIGNAIDENGGLYGYNFAGIAMEIVLRKNLNPNSMWNKLFINRIHKWGKKPAKNIIGLFRKLGFGTISIADSILSNALRVTGADKLLNSKVAGETAEKVAKEGAEEVLEKATKKSIKSTVGEVKDAAVKNIDEMVEELGKTNSMLKKFLDSLLDNIKAFFDNNTVWNKIKEAISSKATNKLTGEAAEKAAKEALEQTSERLFKELVEQVSKNAAKAISKLASWAIPVIGPLINIGFVLADFSDGFFNAERIYGIAEEATDYVLTFGHRVIAGLMNGLLGGILCGLIPTEMVMGILLELLGPHILDDYEELLEAQNETTDMINEILFNDPDADVNADNLHKYLEKRTKFDDKVASGDYYYQLNKETGLMETYKYNGDFFGIDVKDEKLDYEDIYNDNVNGHNKKIMDAFNLANPNRQVKSEEEYEAMIAEYKHVLSGKTNKIDAAASNKKIVNIDGVYYFQETNKSGSDIWGSTIETPYIPPNFNYESSIYKPEQLNLNTVPNTSTQSSTTSTTNSLINDTVSRSPNYTFNPAGYGRTSQKGSIYSSMRYGTSTIGEAGCGPVAASNMINGISVPEAANYAEKYGFVDKDGGTQMNYFNSLFDSQGISNKSTTSPTDVLNTLDNGGKAVLLGKDNINGAFGDQNHFINAIGKRGPNILVDDPELGIRELSANKVLSGMKGSVLVGRGSTSGVWETYIGSDGDTYRRINTNENNKLASIYYDNNYRMSSDFGWRTVQGSTNDHKGVDFVGNGSIKLITPLKGTVSKVYLIDPNVEKNKTNSGKNLAGSDQYGNYVIIDVGDGFQLRYAHLSAANVRLNQNVNRGAMIGLQGSTGWSTGDHVHFEVIKDGVRIDPIPFLHSLYKTQGTNLSASELLKLAMSEVQNSTFTSSQGEEETTKVNTLSDTFGALATNIMKKMYGPAYDFLFGSDNEIASEGPVASSGDINSILDDDSAATSTSIDEAKAAIDDGVTKFHGNMVAMGRSKANNKPKMSTLKSNVLSGKGSGTEGIDPKVIVAVLEILSRISDNTEQLREITKLLSDKGISTPTVTESKNTKTQSGKSRQKTTTNKTLQSSMSGSGGSSDNNIYNDSSIRYIMSVMDQIAKQ